MCFLRFVWLLVLSFFISSPINHVYGDNDPPGDVDRAALIAFKKLMTSDHNNCTQGWDENLISHCGWGARIECNEGGRLTAINLGDCGITGSLAEELGNSTELIYLSLYGNVFNGTIPRKLGSLHNLRNLDLSNNSLSGNIPHELGNLTSLTNLNLEDNFLEGPIPDELNNLKKKLYVIDLSSNQLSGAVPLGNLPRNFPALLRVNLTKNKAGKGGLTGECTQVPCCYDLITREPTACEII